MDTPQADDLLLWIAAIVTAITAIVGGLMMLHRWLLASIRQDITDVRDAIQDVRKEVHPNHGSSLRDAVNTIRDRQGELIDDMREHRSRMENHLQWHLDN